MARVGPTGTAVLALRDCSFAYRSAIVLDQVRLEQNAGEVLALLGPNGAGKSTLIRCICGRLTPDQGEVRVVGQDPRRSPAARAAIGLVPQQLALYPFLTVRENLAAFAALAGMKKAGRSAAVELTLLRSELGAVAGQPAGTLSGGWQRRLNIACAIVHQPRILVLDEPTVGVDPPARAGIEALLQRLAADGMAILITSHELDQLERLADRAAFLRDGRIVADGAPAQSGRLEGCGLQAHGVDRRNWSGLIDGERARTLPGELAGNSDVELLHLQRPGLSALWRSIYGTEPERTS
jgi:ABC-2 type transport system ATP-binding protein